MARDSPSLLFSLLSLSLFLLLFTSASASADKPAVHVLTDNNGRAFKLVAPYSPDYSTPLLKKMAAALLNQSDIETDSAHEHRHRGLMAREFVNDHNAVRSRLHLPPVQWDKNLAHYARQWASTVAATGCEMRHSMGPYGENIFWGGGSSWTPTDAVKLWSAESAFYNLGSNSCLPDKMCGHYTQVVWKSSVKLGCDRVQCNNGDVFITCNYDPPGNYIGERPFDP